MRYIKFLTILIFSAFLLPENIHANEYIAFSLKVAQQIILSTPPGKDYRKLHSEVFTLGGITAMNGLVYDRKTSDVILVGQRDPDRAVLTLDDFVVALRARFIHGKWPLVSIDPTPETEKTQMQVVRFEGGIEDTQFGQDLFDADYRLKQIGMGLLFSGVPGFKSGWDLGMEWAKQQTSKSSHITSRFWFYPVLPNVSVREDVVAIKGLKVGVFTEVMSAEIDGKKIEDSKTFQYTAGDEFAKQVTDKFEALSKAHPSFSRVHGLDEIVALVNAIENMDERPDLDWWSMKYQVKRVETVKALKVLRKEERYLWMKGGVQLTAIALKFKAGDIMALKDAVLKTRPKPDTLSWGFLVGEWLISTSTETLRMEDIVPLFRHACFLDEKKRYDDAITLYGKIIELKPGWDWAYNNRGVAYSDKGLHDQAIADYNNAVNINSECIDAYYNRGISYSEKCEYVRAIADFNKVLEINPKYFNAYINRGTGYAGIGEYDRAIADFNHVLELGINQCSAIAIAYYNRGKLYHDKGKYNNAIDDYDKAIEINPLYANAYNNRGVVYNQKREYDRAIADFNHALKVNPNLTEAYYNRGLAWFGKEFYDQVISDFSHVLRTNPEYAGGSVYNDRGVAYYFKGEYNKAWEDVCKARSLGFKVHTGFIEALQQSFRKIENGSQSQS